MERIYICIDLKSFYASVECRERNLDPLTTNLVVADSKRTEKTICLAVSPSLKEYGIPGRARLYEVVQKVKEVNKERRKKINFRKFTGKSFDSNELNNYNLEFEFIIAPPRMKLYMKYSTDIYKVYLKYLSKDDIFVYSIDEVFCDITEYLSYYNMTPRELVTTIIHDVYKTTGITATAGIGTNMYLCKIAMDIVAKHVPADKEGVRIACLDVMRYRKYLWNHKPITDFWRVGNGYSKRLESIGIYTMGDIARASIEREDILYKLFGVKAELLIDHAWGYEPCTIKDVKSYKPKTSSISSGQVLHVPYDFKKTRLIVKEMIDLLALDLVSKKYVSDTFTLTIGYDISNLTDSNIKYEGDVTEDHYGRKIPKHAHGTARTLKKTSSTRMIMKSIIDLYDRIVDKKLLVRRINISADNLVNEYEAKDEKIYHQFDLFSDSTIADDEKKNDIIDEKEERKIQEVVLKIKNKYGKNVILKGMNLEEGATTIDRNKQVGGHRG